MKINWGFPEEMLRSIKKDSLSKKMNSRSIKRTRITRFCHCLREKGRKTKKKQQENSVAEPGR